MEKLVVVVGADFAEAGDDAIRAGLQQLASGAAQTLHVVHVLDARDALLPREEPATPAAPAPSPPRVLESLARRVRTIADLEHVPYHDGQVKVEVRRGAVLPGLLAAIRQHRADLAVVGTHERQGVNRWFTGSVAEKLVGSSECSVLIARVRRGAERRSEQALAEQSLPEHELPHHEPAWRPNDIAGELTRR